MSNLTEEAIEKMVDTITWGADDDPTFTGRELAEMIAIMAHALSRVERHEDGSDPRSIAKDALDRVAEICKK